MLSHFSHVQLLETLWTIACQSLLFMEFSRQEYWSGLLCPPSGGLLNPGSEPRSPAAPALQADSSPLTHWEAHPQRYKIHDHSVIFHKRQGLPGTLLPRKIWESLDQLYLGSNSYPIKHLLLSWASLGQDIDEMGIFTAHIRISLHARVTLSSCISASACLIFLLD